MGPVLILSMLVEGVLGLRSRLCGALRAGLTSARCQNGAIDSYSS